MQIASSEKLNLFGNALPGGDLPLNAPGSKSMICFLPWCWPEVDTVLDHSEDVANVCVIFGRVALSLECDLVSDASFPCVEEAKEIQVQEAPVSICIDMMSPKYSVDACVVAGEIGRAHV